MQLRLQGITDSRVLRAMLDLVPRDARFDMPQLFDACRSAGLSTHAYPVEEYWVDIGQIDDYRRANTEFAATF